MSPTTFPEYYLTDETATQALGAAVAEVLTEGGIVTLSGDLGAGKTTFSRGLIHACGHRGAVKSPTYTLVEPYEQCTPAVMHFDLYRLADPEELDFIGFRDYLSPSNLCLIEWPEKGQPLIPPADLALSIHLDPPGRRVSWQTSDTALGLRIHQRLQQFFT